MVRPLRIDIADGWYHVYSRGTERRAIFKEDGDRSHFLGLLAELHERYRIRIHAYVLMDNHYHGIFQTPDANLSEGMQWFHGSYGAWYNARHRRVGSLFQGRFRAIPMENGGWGYTLSLYVHLNPLRIAGLGLDKRGRMLEGLGWRRPTPDQVGERLRRLRSYAWSSYRVYAGYSPGPDWLEMGEILSRAHADKERRQAAYRAATRRLLTNGVEPSRMERLRDAVAIGSVEFARRMRCGSEQKLSGISGKRELRRRMPVMDVRRAVEQVKGATWKTFGQQYGDWGCALFLWGVRRWCGLTLQEAGRQAGGMSFSAVGKAIQRFELQAEYAPHREKLQHLLFEMSNVEP